MAGKKKLSTAISRGSKHYREVRQSFIAYDDTTGKKCGCALGSAVLELTGGEAEAYLGFDNITAILAEQCGEMAANGMTKHPVSGWTMPRSEVINDLHHELGWSREAIAVWVSEDGY